MFQFNEIRNFLNTFANQDHYQTVYIFTNDLFFIVIIEYFSVTLSLSLFYFKKLNINDLSHISMVIKM